MFTAARQWINKFLFDPTYFTDFSQYIRSGFRFSLAMLGYLMQIGIIPTYIDGGGQKYGPALMVLAFLVKSQGTKR